MQLRVAEDRPANGFAACRSRIPLHRQVASRSDVPSYATAVLFERSAERSIDIAKAAAEFQLSDRERETVVHLMQGLTSKEIAQRMGISPYTVKTYVKLVMIKLGVTTRSGIVGKLVRGSARQY